MPNTFPAVCYVALGSNLDTPVHQVQSAMAAVGQLPETRLHACSSLYRSAAMGFVNQPDFINAVVCVHSALSPEQLLIALLELERQFGRVRSFRNAPREIDLDILLYNQVVSHSDTLTLPHMRMHERAFVLIPLLEIAPNIEIPGRGLARDFLTSVVQQPIERIAQNSFGSHHESSRKASLHCR